MFVKFVCLLKKFALFHILAVSGLISVKKVISFRHILHYLLYNVNFLVVFHRLGHCQLFLVQYKHTQ